MTRPDCPKSSYGPPSIGIGYFKGSNENRSGRSGLQSFDCFESEFARGMYIVHIMNHYSEILNKSTGTIEKKHQNILRYALFAFRMEGQDEPLFSISWDILLLHAS